ncbi:MAG: hypothetical protein ACTHJR_01050 [Sphingomonas sp.]|uniref:hypothetical protein n=1 Tax=Sphingomonas sp. TaxID=28214 RepID=UPI003F7EF45C
MGVLWTVWPLDEQMRTWLDEQGVAFPDKASRFPTGGEIKAMIAGFHGTADVTDNGIGHPYSAFLTIGAVDSELWTLLQITSFTGDDEPQELWFEKGHEQLIIDILRKLTPASGPLALIADVGDPPQIIE